MPRAYHFGKRVHLLVGRDERRLNEELVLALGVGGRVGRESLQDNCGLARSTGCGVDGAHT